MEDNYIEKKRVSKVLTSSALPCFQNIVTLNITDGCIHQCIYCYANFTCHKKIGIYMNLVELFKKELDLLKLMPRRIYFSPSADAFQNDKRVQKITRDIIKYTLEQTKIDISFLTKGIIEEETMNIMKKYPDRINAQIGLNTTNEKLAHIIEPNVPKPSERLDQISTLLKYKIKTTVRVDPIFPGLTDDPELLSKLFNDISKRGITELSFSFLFLRKYIRKNLEKEDDDQINEMLKKYDKITELKLHSDAGGTIESLLLVERLRRSNNIIELAKKFGITCHICKCKNPDFENNKIEDIEDIQDAVKNGCFIAGETCQKACSKKTNFKAKNIMKFLIQDKEKD